MDADKIAQEAINAIAEKIKNLKTLNIIVAGKTGVGKSTLINSVFRDNLVEFDIICHFDQWQLDDFQLRPYRIAAEIDSMFNGKHLTGIGKLDFFGAKQIILNSEFGGLCLMFEAIHGEEDKAPMVTPAQQEAFEKDFKAMHHLT